MYNSRNRSGLLKLQLQTERSGIRLGLTIYYKKINLSLEITGFLCPLIAMAILCFNQNAAPLNSRARVQY